MGSSEVKVRLDLDQTVFTLLGPQLTVYKEQLPTYLQNLSAEEIAVIADQELKSDPHRPTRIFRREGDTVHFLGRPELAIPWGDFSPVRKQIIESPELMRNAPLLPHVKDALSLLGSVEAYDTVRPDNDETRTATLAAITTAHLPEAPLYMYTNTNGKIAQILHDIDTDAVPRVLFDDSAGSLANDIAGGNWGENILRKFALVYFGATPEQLRSMENFTGGTIIPGIQLHARTHKLGFTIVQMQRWEPEQMGDLQQFLSETLNI